MSTTYPKPALIAQPLRDGIAVVRALYQSAHPLSVQQIMTNAHLTYSRVEKSLYTLEMERLVEHDEKYDLWSIHSDGLWAAFGSQEKRG